MLDDRDGRRREFGDQLEGGIGAVEVVVAERLALELLGADDARPRIAARIGRCCLVRVLAIAQFLPLRSEEHTSELQSLMRISYAVFCLKKKNTRQTAN